MKKLFALLLSLMLICFAATALAVEAKPGENVVVTLSITSNPDNAAIATIGFSYDSNVLEYVSASAAGSNMMPGGATGAFTCTNLNGLPTGAIGTVTFRVKAGTTAESTVVSAVAQNAYTNAYKAVSIGVNSVKISIVQPKCEHTYNAGEVTTAATCTAAGVKTYTCTKCGTTKTEEIPALGHSYDDGVQTKAPTCKEEGVLTTTCATCGDKKTEAIAKSDKHTWDEGVVTKEMTCLADGEKTFTCTVCGLKDVTVVKAPGKHTYDATKVETEKAPTCTEAGKGSFTCTVCGTKIDGGEIPALDHDKKVTVTKEATCGADGEKTTTCSRCDYKEVEKIPATGEHKNETKVTTEATCAKAGVETTTCTVCGKTETKEIPATGKHTNETKMTTEVTCGQDGVETTTCTVCGKTETKKIPATGKHTYEEKVTKEATCTEKGEKTFTCSVCGDKYTEEIAAKGHAAGADLQEKKPTCTKPGYKYFTCTDCGTEVKESDIPATGEHIYEVTEEVAPTCDKDGKRVSKCTYEGCTKVKKEVLKKLGHAYGEWIIDEENNKKTHVCGTCGKVETKTLSTQYFMTVCSHGIRFRDLENPITKEWYMFTPIDLSIEGEQNIDLIAGNLHRIGTATVLVKDGKVTVTTKVNNFHSIAYEEEFLTFIPALADITEVNFETMTNYAYGEEISIEEDLGGDIKVLLLMRNRAWYEDSAYGVKSFDAKGKEYNAYVESLKELMD